MKRLDDMLTAAINGSFSEKNFDESRLSALESRLWRYLTASALSERNVREQKDQISALISDISHQTKTRWPISSSTPSCSQSSLSRPRGRTVLLPSLLRRKSSKTSSRPWLRPPAGDGGSWPSTLSPVRSPQRWSGLPRSMPPGRRKRHYPDRWTEGRFRRVRSQVDGGGGVQPAVQWV